MNSKNVASFLVAFACFAGGTVLATEAFSAPKVPQDNVVTTPVVTISGDAPTAPAFYQAQEETVVASVPRHTTNVHVTVCAPRVYRLGGWTQTCR